MSILITGGAGYIGSHMTFALADRGERMIVLDNLSTGARGLVAPAAEFVEGDVADQKLVCALIDRRDVDTVIHFAGSVVVADSIVDPLGYYANNSVASRSLIEASAAKGLKRFIFSSTAAVYGNGGDAPLPESAPKEPINPYGRSKLATEWVLEDTACASDLGYAVLRYFNVAGADPAGRTGQSGPRATHLIRLACQTALGKLPHLDIYGTDYPTRDGTCVRDYIHVCDLISAHLLALDALRRGIKSAVYNAGYGRGFTVREVVAAVERASGRALPTRDVARRQGDPPTLVADPACLKRDLGWAPQYDDLDIIVQHAFAWEQKLG